MDDLKESSKLSPNKIIVVLILVTVFVLVLIAIYTAEQMRQQTELITSERMLTMHLLSEKIESMVNNSIQALQIASYNDEVWERPNTYLIDPSLHGIPKNQDLSKRTILNILHNTYNFETVLYVLPNGDVYLAEPYARQESLTVSNFAFREWYKNMIETQKSNIDPIIISRSTGHPISAINVPIFSQDGTFTGILSASLDLNIIQQTLQEIITEEMIHQRSQRQNDRIILSDNNGNVVSDTSKAVVDIHQYDPKISYMTKALAGEEGTAIEMIDGKEMYLVYHPVKILQNTWGLILIQPYEDIFSSAESTRKESIVLLVTISSIATIAGYIIRRLSMDKERYARHLEESNEFLKHTQRILIEAEEKYRNLFELSPNPIRIVDLNGNTVSCNQIFEKKFGYNKEEIIGKKIYDVIDEKYKDIAHKYFNELKTTGRLENRELWYKKKDGTSFPASLNVSILRDKNNSPIGYISIITDTSESYHAKRKIEEDAKIIKSQIEQLKTIDKLKNEFSSMVSHELRTPLFPIQFYSQLLKDPQISEKLSESQLQAIDEIYKNTVILNKLIDDILDVEKLEIGKMKFTFQNIELNKFMEEIKKSHTALMNEKQIEFVDTTKEDIQIKIDPDRLKQVFSNLIVNAIFFVPDKGGRIEIGAKRNNDDIVFYVKDNGIGIAKEKQQNLFKKFYQIDTSLSRKHHGSGLGLSICKGMVEGHGGKIWLESDIGKGATFYFNVPINNRRNS